MRLRTLFQLSKMAFKNWRSDFAPSMGAALAYYTVFSIAPLLVITIAVTGLVYGEEVAQAAVLDQARTLVGENGSKAIESMLASAQRPKQGAIAGILGVITLLIGATTVFAELENNLNRIWKAEKPKHSGLWSFVRTRLLSFGLILAVGFLLIVSLVLTAVISAMGKYWERCFGDVEALLQMVNFIVPVAIITVLFAMIYKFLPNVSIRWRDVWIGALTTSLLFSLGKFGIGLYLGKASVESSYGAAGALVVLLVWVYYSAQIFLLGAEFTKVYAEHHGSLRGRKTPQPDQPRTEDPPSKEKQG
jgi:membrane protein